MRAVLYGYGRVSQSTHRLTASRPWLHVSGLIGTRDRPPSDSTQGLAVHADASGLLERLRPDVVIVATRSRIADVMPQLRIAVAAGPRAILCTAEELAWLAPDDPAREELTTLAREYGVAVVATGVNPGFVLDLWPLVASGLAWDVRSIHARRVSDVSGFAPVTRSRLGLDHTPESFAAGVMDGSVVGHLGFPESIRILGARLGRPIDEVRLSTEPVIADRRYELPDGVVEPGRTIGADQRAVGLVDGVPWITIELMVHGAPTAGGVPAIDEVLIEDEHPIHVRVDPGFAGVRGTVALLVNGIPEALRAAPGLHGPADLPPTAPWLGATLARTQ